MGSRQHGWRRWGAAVFFALAVTAAVHAQGAAQGARPSLATGPTHEAETAAGPAGPGQTLVSNIFIETFITQALQDIAMQAGVNVLTDPGVQGFVTLELNDVPFEQALRMILAPGGFTYVKLDETTYLVGRPDRSSPIFSELTQTRLVRFNHVTAEQARRLISEYYTTYVRFEAETNTALITAPPGLLERIASDLAQLDQPRPQVAIEAIVTEVSEEGRKELGLDWQVRNEPAGALKPETYELQTFGGVPVVTLQSPYTLLHTTLRRLVSEGKATIRANPRLTVLDGDTAQIFVGEDRYFKIVTGSDAAPFTRLEAINVGVSLSITPRVSQNGEITLTVRPTVSDVTGQVGSDDLPVISRREIVTTVRVHDGETLALGGLVQESTETITTRVPVLGDLPLLRYLFSSTRERHTSSEVLVLITPRLLTP